jgi:hypothetical protein
MPPWEKYAAQGDGPWAKYGDQKPVKSKARQDAEIVGDALQGKFGNFSLPKPLANINKDILSRARGAGLGWLDDAAGAVYGASVDAANALAPLVGRKGNPYSGAEGSKAVRDVLNEIAQKQRSDAPVSTLANELAGGSWVPGAKFIGGSKTLGQAALRSAAVGGAIGGITGAGESEGSIKDRAKGAAKGAAIGAAVGGTAPYVARGAQAVARRVGAAAAETADRVRLGFGGDLPEPSPAQIQRAEGNALDYVRGLARRTPNALANNAVEAAGKPITAAEALGRPGVTGLGAVARRSGATGDALESTLRQRQHAMPERLLNDLSEVTGLSPEAVGGDIDHIVKMGQQEAAPLFKAAFEARPGILQTERLSQLSRRPVVKKALSTVAADMLNSGRDPEASGFVVRGMTEGGLPDVVDVKGATAETWDAVRKAIGRQVERHPITGRPLPDSQSQGNYGIGVATKDLTDELKNAIPGYGAALDRSSDYLRADSAFKAAKSLMSENVPYRVFARRFDAMTDADKQAHISGFVNDAFERAQSGRLRLRDLQSLNFQRKLTSMLGDARARAMVDKIAQEVDLARTGGRMMPGVNSPTFEYLAADKEREEAIGSLVGAGRSLARGKPLEAAAQVITAPVIGAYRGARVPLDRATRDEVGRLLQLSPSELNNVLAEYAARNPSAFSAPRTARISNALAQGAGSSVAKN